MRQINLFLTMSAVAAGMFFFGMQGRGMTDSTAEKKGPMIGHNVYFTLKDASPESQKKLVDACKQYLEKHPGVLYFGAGTVAELDRPVNDRDWHVGLHVFFKDMESHDLYQKAELHLKFIEENKENWAKVRVFDTEYK